MVNGAASFVVSKKEYLTSGPKTISVTQSFVQILFKVKITEKASDIDREGQESMNLSSLV